MSGKDEKYSRRRLAASQITTVISITLVLFLLGLLGLIVLHARILADHVRENIGFSVMIREGVKEAEILHLKKMFDTRPYVKSSEYITGEAAARKLKAELGEDFIGFLGYNPLLPVINLRIRAPYATNDSLQAIGKRLEAIPVVQEVWYQKSLVDQINANLEKISLVLLAFSGILLFIAVVLIHNTIRLGVYARRFLIRSMQLVGATEAFIRRPLLLRSILNGLLSAFFALLILMAVTWLALEEIPELAGLQDPVMLIFLAGAILLLGAAISWSSTRLAVRKYLRIHTDHLYH